MSCLAQGFDQSWAGISELRAVLQTQFLQHLFAFAGERYEHLAPVHGAPVTLYQAGFRQPVHQLDSAMMLDLQALGNFGDPRAPSRWQAFQR
jgi:hypothetical protein